MSSLRELCIQPIITDSDIERRKQNKQVLQEIMIPVLNNWEYISVKLYRNCGNDPDEEASNILLGNCHGSFEDTEILTPFECMFRTPTKIELYISRTFEDETFFSKKWIFHYDNDGEKPSKIIITNQLKCTKPLMQLQTQEYETTVLYEIDHYNNHFNVIGETIQAHIDSHEAQEHFIKILTSCYINKTLRDLVWNDESMTWIDVKEFVSKLFKLDTKYKKNKYNKNISIYIDVREDPTSSEAYSEEDSDRELEYIQSIL